MFAKYFSSIFTRHSSSQFLTPSQSVHPTCHFTLPFNAHFSINDVHQSLCSFRNINSVGPDGIQGDYLYELRSVLTEPLWLLFRRSINSGIFASALKIGSIRPTLKSGVSTYVTNYRHITILPNLSKLFETLVLNSISSFFNHILVDEQHGFRRKKSIITCNLSLHLYVFNYFRDNCQVDEIYTDFSKTFDRVDHKHICQYLTLWASVNLYFPDFTHIL